MSLAAPRSTVVIGAGVTGLAAAWRLASSGVPVVVIEKGLDIGGLAGTIDWDGWRFDYGPHNFHTKDLPLVDFYKQKLPERFLERHIKVKLYIFSKLVSYPMVGANALLSLGGTKMLQASWSFFLARLRALIFGIAPTDYLDEWIVRRFGKVLYDTYFGPYIRRVWKADPHHLSPMIGEMKIPLLSIRRLILRELFGREVKNPNDLSQWRTFYVRGGVGEISRYFAREIEKAGGRILLGEELKALRLKDGRAVALETSAQTIDVSQSEVISTIPLNTLVGKTEGLPETVRLQAQKLEFCSERFLFIRVKRPVVSGFHWVYFSDKRYPFNRVAEFNHDEFSMVPKDHTSLTFEYPCNENDWEWNAPTDELFEKTLPLYAEVFPLRREDILDYRTAYQRHAYPRFVTGIEKSLKELFSSLDCIPNLQSTGRQGRFCYVNVDGATRLGLEAAERILKTGGL